MSFGAHNHVVKGTMYITTWFQGTIFFIYFIYLLIYYYYYQYYFIYLFTYTNKVLNWRYQLMQVDLYNGRKVLVVVLLSLLLLFYLFT